MSNTFGPLDYPIEPSEIKNSIQSLKNGKAAGQNMILNEMLKASETLINKPLCHLFNKILKSGNYPKTWRESIMIVPIPKCGDPNNVDNYRGIAISSCLSKVLNKILNERLEQYMEASGK